MKKTACRILPALSLLTLVAFCSGCRTAEVATWPPTESTAGPWDWLPEEERLIEVDRDDFDVVVKNGPGSHVLRRRTRWVPDHVDLTEVAARMEKSMHLAGGAGIAAPQVGLNLRVAVLMIDYMTDDPHVIFVRNPIIIERSDETKDGYEGCLSVPDVGGLVRRNCWVRVAYITAEGERAEVKAEGANAVLWQHELDHLDGVLYTDRVLGELLPWEEVKRLREAETSGQSDNSG